MTRSDAAFHQVVKVRRFAPTGENYFKIHRDRIDLLESTLRGSAFPGIVSERRLYKHLIELC